MKSTPAKEKLQSKDSQVKGSPHAAIFQYFQNGQEMQGTFLPLGMAKRSHFFLGLQVLIPRKKLNWQNTKFALTCSFQKVICAHLVVLKNLTTHFFF